MVFKSKKRERISLKFILLAIVMVVVFLFVYQFTKIKNKEEEIKKINDQILVQENKNNQILDIINSRESDKESISESNKKNSVRVFEGVVK